MRELKPLGPLQQKPPETQRCPQRTTVCPCVWPPDRRDRDGPRRRRPAGRTVCTPSRCGSRRSWCRRCEEHRPSGPLNTLSPTRNRPSSKQRSATGSPARAPAMTEMLSLAGGRRRFTDGDGGAAERPDTPAGPLPLPWLDADGSARWRAAAPLLSRGLASPWKEEGILPAA